MQKTLIVCLLWAAFAVACGAACSPAREGKATPTQSPESDPMASVQPEPSVGDETLEDTLAVSYLEATVEPCSPAPRIDGDPCEAGRFLEGFSVWLHYNHPDGRRFPGAPTVEPWIIHPPWTVQQKVEHRFGLAHPSYDNHHPIHVPHIVARGVYLPETTRCMVHDKISYVTGAEIGVVESGELHEDARTPMTHCFTEFEVREYLIGKGPETLTVSPMTRLLYSSANHDLYKQDAYLTELARRIDEIWQGAESIVWLTPGDDNRANVEAWHVYRSFDLQKSTDGRLVVRDMLWDSTLDRQQDLSPYEHLIAPELDDYRRDVALAFEEAARETGVTLVEDANREHLRDFMKNHGLHDVGGIVIVLPPAVPSE